MRQNEPRPDPSPLERLERFRELLRRAKGYWLGALVVVVVVTTAAILAILHLPRVYMSETLILAQDAIRADTRDQTPTVSAVRIGPKLKDLLVSRSRLERVIRDLGLYQREIEQRGMQDAVDEMRLHIGFRARDSDTFLISFESDDPKIAQLVAEKLAESLIDDFVSDNVKRARATRDFLVEEERRAAQDLDQKGRELSAFVAQHPQFAFDPTRTQIPLGTAGAQAALAAPAGAPPSRPASDPDLARLYRERASIESQLGALFRVPTGLTGAGAPGPQGNGAGPSASGPLTLEQQRQQLAADLTAAQADLADKRRRYTDVHPDLIAARSRVVNVARALAGVEQQLAQARGAQPIDQGNPQAAELQRQLAEVKSAIAARERTQAQAPRPAPASGAPAPGATPGSTNATPYPPMLPNPMFGGGPMSGAKLDGFVALETEWQRLTQAAAEARRAKDDVSDRRARADILASAAESSGATVMTIIDPAYLPLRPIRPNRRLAGLLAAGSALVLGMLWAIAGVLLSDVVRDAADLEASGATPVLAVIPKERVVSSSRSEIVLHRPGPRTYRWAAGDPGLSDAEPDAHAVRRRTIVTAPSGAGPRERFALPTAALATRAPHGEERPPEESLRPVPAQPICSIGPDVVVAARRALRPLSRESVATLPNESWFERDPWPRRVQNRDWRRDLDGTETDGRLDGASEPCAVLLEAPPDQARASTLLSAATLAALRILRHGIEQHARQGGTVVGITSAVRGEGKTRLAAQLSLTLAESNRARVLLVEANFERPALEGLFGLHVPAGCGFSAQIQRRMADRRGAAWGVVSLGPALHVLVESGADERAPSALHAREFALAIAELRRRYDYVVIDGPSIMDGGNATSVETVVDGLLMVARAGVSKSAVVKRAGRTLGTRRLLGFVLTDAQEGRT